MATTASMSRVQGQLASLRISAGAKSAVQGPASLAMRSSELTGAPARLALQQAQAAQAVPAQRQVAGVRAAKREEELKEIRAMSSAEIEQAVFDLKGELFLLRARQATRLEYKASDFGRIRKRIARMLTVRRERELEQGVDKRASRKLDRAWRKSVIPKPPPSYNPDDWKK